MPHFKMNDVAITRKQIPCFQNCSVLYVNCIDSAVKIDEAPSDLPFISFRMLIGHANFPDELKNRRMVLFLNTPDKEVLCRRANARKTASADNILPVVNFILSTHLVVTNVRDQTNSATQWAAVTPLGINKVVKSPKPGQRPDPHCSYPDVSFSWIMLIFFRK